MSVSTDRIRVKLPPGFDERKHLSALMQKVTASHGAGYELNSIDPIQGVAHLSRQAAVAEVTVSTVKPDSFDVRLPRGTKPADGDKIATQMADQYSEYGVVMTKFEPFLGRATLSKLDEDSLRARGAFSVALGCKEWDIQIAKRTDGGFELELPKTYVPSRHDTKLDEVATMVVGRIGWRVKVDANTLKAQVIPGDPPLFPGAVAYPIEKLGKKDGWDFTRFGVRLPETGVGTGPEIGLDWTQSAWLLLAGTPGSGKGSLDSTLVPVPLSERFPTGWARHGDLQIGDQVISRDGTIVDVDFISDPWTEDAYDLTFSDGQTIRVDGSHLWLVSTRESRVIHGRSNTKAKRAKADAKRQAERNRLTELAMHYCEHKVGATTRQCAEIIGISHSRMSIFLSKSGIPFEHGAGGPGLGRPKVYPVDEVINAWLGHVIEVQDAQEATSQPLMKVISTREMAESVKVSYDENRLNYAVPVAAAAQFPELELPLDPYALGVWLGYGGSHGAQIWSGVSESCTDVETGITDQMFLIEQLAISGFAASPSQGATDQADRLLNVPGMRTPLRELGVLGAKHIPAAYQRASIEQRLALLQGLMDTDGTVDPNGCCELSLSDERLVNDALSLIRSLGIKASKSVGPVGYKDAEGNYVACKDRHRIHFTTDLQVFRLPRKARRLPQDLRVTAEWNYITSIEPAGEEMVKCIRVNHPEHTYLVADFIPTHNTVTLNALIAQQLAAGAQLVVCDEKSKAVDFLWCKQFVRPGGWGCDSEAHAVASLAMVYEEGQRRAKILEEKGVVNWLDLDPEERFQPIFIVVDEVSALLVQDPVPKGVPKDHPIVVEINDLNFKRALIGRFINKIIAEQRFVGIRMVLSTQVTNAQTGLPPSLKNKIGHRVLQGTNPSKPARTQSFNDEAAVPYVPEHVKASGDGARGVGAADLEGMAPAIYKSYFAKTKVYKEALEKLHVPTTDRPAPTALEVAKYAPSLEDTDEDLDSMEREFLGGELTPSGKPVSSLDPKFGPGERALGADGKPLRGAAAGAHALAQAAGGAKSKSPAQRAAAKEEANWASRAGDVIVTHAAMCPTCEHPIHPTTGQCRCP